MIRWLFLALLLSGIVSTYAQDDDDSSSSKSGLPDNADLDAKRVPLHLLFNGEYTVLTTQDSEKSKYTALGYKYMRQLGYIYEKNYPGLIALHRAKTPNAQFYAASRQLSDLSEDTLLGYMLPSTVARDQSSEQYLPILTRYTVQGRENYYYETSQARVDALGTQYNVTFVVSKPLGVIFSSRTPVVYAPLKPPTPKPNKTAKPTDDPDNPQSDSDGKPHPNTARAKPTEEPEGKAHPNTARAGPTEEPEGKAHPNTAHAGPTEEPEGKPHTNTAHAPPTQEPEGKPHANTGHATEAPTEEPSSPPHANTAHAPPTEEPEEEPHPDTARAPPTEEPEGKPHPNTGHAPPTEEPEGKPHPNTGHKPTQDPDEDGDMNDLIKQSIKEAKKEGDEDLYTRALRKLKNKITDRERAAKKHDEELKRLEQEEKQRQAAQLEERARVQLERLMRVKEEERRKQEAQHKKEQAAVAARQAALRKAYEESLQKRKAQYEELMKQKKDAESAAQQHAEVQKYLKASSAQIEAHASKGGKFTPVSVEEASLIRDGVSFVEGACDRVCAHSVWLMNKCLTQAGDPLAVRLGCADHWCEELQKCQQKNCGTHVFKLDSGPKNEFLCELSSQATREKV